MRNSIFRSWKSKIFYEEILNSPEVYTDRELERIKKAGHSGIWVAGILRDISFSDVFPELNKKSNRERIEALKTLVSRAEKYKLDVFVYLVEPRCLSESDPFWEKYPEVKGTYGHTAMLEYKNGYAMCTSEPKVLKFLENSTYNLFKSVPGLKGLIIVTASEHLHHCLSWSTPVWQDIYKKQYPELCKRCRDRNPSKLVSEIINAISSGVYSARKDAEIIASVWGWTWYEELPHANLINSLDSRIAIESFFEKKGIKEEEDGGKKVINEYCLSYTGPSQYNLVLFDFLRKNNRRFYIKMVLGTTHEMVTVPCIPVPTRIYEKLKAAHELKPDGYIGFTFGTITCINLFVFEKILGLEDFPDDMDTFMKNIAAEYFPGCDAEMVYRAWRIFSSAINPYPFSNALVYYGPVSYALAYKQYPGSVQGKPMNPTWLPLSRDGDDLDSVCIDYKAETIIERFEEMSERFKKGLVYYRKGLKNVNPETKEKELGYAEIIPLVFSSVANIFKIHLLKRQWKPSKMRQFRKIMEEELKICKKALPFVKKDNLLGYHIEAGTHLFSEKLIKEKIRHIQSILTGRRYENIEHSGTS